MKLTAFKLCIVLLCTVGHVNCAFLIANDRCPHGFEGEGCSVNTDDCVGNHCLNNSTCIDGINTYTCECPPQFTGPFCSVDIGKLINC